jgi:hypothetical protein
MAGWYLQSKWSGWTVKRKCPTKALPWGICSPAKVFHQWSPHIKTSPREVPETPPSVSLRAGSRVGD